MACQVSTADLTPNQLPWGILSTGYPTPNGKYPMPLTDAKVRSATPRDKAYKLHDSDGLFLLATPAGGRLWRFRYRFGGKEKLLAIGSYPRLGLREARRKRDEAMDLLEAGTDPAQAKASRKRAAALVAAHPFEDVAREWHKAQTSRWSELYAHQVLVRFENEVFPELGRRPLAQIEPPDVLAVLRAIEARGVHETTHRMRSQISAVFAFAIASGYCRYDPAAHLSAALVRTPKAEHYARLSRDEVGEFLLRLDAHNCEPLTRLAIKLAMLSALRTNELRGGDWRELERLDEPGRALWRVPPERVKMGVEHLVPLSRQAVELILSLPSANRREGRLFPGEGKTGVMSNNTMLFAIYRLGYKHRTTTHGFRSLFSTECNENGFESDWIERQLAHDERNDVRAAYNAAQYLPQRRKMMQWWADYLGTLRAAEEARRREVRKIDPEPVLEDMEA